MEDEKGGMVKKDADEMERQRGTKATAAAATTTGWEMGDGRWDTGRGHGPTPPRLPNVTRGRVARGQKNHHN